MKKSILSFVLALAVVVIPLRATAQVTSLPGSNNNANLIAQLEQIIALLEQLQDLRDQLAEIQSGNEVATVDESAGETVTSEQETEVSATTKERNYISAVASCTTARIKNVSDVYVAKAELADYATKVLNFPRFSLQQKFEMITDHNEKVTNPRLKVIEDEGKAVQRNCENTIVALPDVMASTSPAVQSALKPIPDEITVFQDQLTLNNSLKDCMRGPLSQTNAGLKQIKETVLTEKCKAKSTFISGEITAKEKQQKALLAI